MDEVLRKRGRPSKLDAFRNQIGKLQDEEVARLAGCSVANVYMYRRRHNILNPGETPETLAADASPESEPSEVVVPVARRKPGRPPKNKIATKPNPPSDVVVNTPDENTTSPTASKLRTNNSTKTKPAPIENNPQSETGGRRQRGSVLDHHRDIIGTLSDAEVARIAGCTPANVSVYRRKHGIADVVPPAPVLAPEPSQVVEAPPVVSAPVQSGNRFAYLIRFLQNGSVVERVLVAGDFPSAMQKAAELEKNGHTIQGARLVGELL